MTPEFVSAVQIPVMNYRPTCMHLPILPLAHLSKWNHYPCNYSNHSLSTLHNSLFIKYESLPSKISLLPSSQSFSLSLFRVSKDKQTKENWLI